MSKLKSEETALKFPNLANPSKSRILKYSGVTYVSLENMSSRVLLFFIQGGNKNVAPISC